MSLTLTDRDLGWRRLQEAIGEADRLELRVGVLSGRPRYPDRGRPQVAKVAGVHGLHRTIAAVIDEHEREYDRRIEQGVMQRIVDGEDPLQALEDVALWLRDLVRARVEDAGLVERGYLLDTIRGVVYAAGRRVAGDRPAAKARPMRG